MKSAPRAGTAIWALTPNGARLARSIARQMSGSTRFLSAKLDTAIDGTIRFSRLKDAIDRHFGGFSSHIFIMATGIVVRCIAMHLAHKTTDPAVVVCDEAGRFAVSLVSGHLGGANALAMEVARITGGLPVITTATDVNRVPAIDVIALENGLTIENSAAIKAVNMALLTGGPIVVHDPYEKLAYHLPASQTLQAATNAFDDNAAGVFVDHIRLDLPPHVLVLRPGSLVAGMGCNRGTSVDEMRSLLLETVAVNKLAASSLRALATVDLKADEPGLLNLAQSLNLKVMLFSRDRLKAVVQVPTPSTLVEKHIGVKSVCEAAALLATNRGRLIVPKQKTANVTVAVAADGYISLASDPVHRST
ncbi:cobalt-precorrin 5A hydrolase [Desulfosarcina sp.]|uniref:cobalt-precorrin 5A hydrolase n=1 Tax=Desulfosarcina sp. TaxID=2027861 RepID=UPI003970775A